MKVAVVGGTGQIGRHAVEALQDAGHEAVVISRSQGVDLLTGVGLDAALEGADAVIDASNPPPEARTVAEDFFATTTGNLLAAEARAGVNHHVLLSIVGIDRVAGNPHYAGKRRQEALVQAGTVPYTIVRATQFHSFAEMVASWTRQGDTMRVPPLLVQPVAASDVGDVLAEIATGPAQGTTIELAGPETQDLVDMARRTFAARGEDAWLVASWRDVPFTVEMAGEVLLPGPDARIAPTTFEDWLAAIREPALA